ncbi:hypothetical protein [Rubrobacter radiotolerans]|nr:hypothetical protein [Rubrobacter radiotolerans]
MRHRGDEVEVHPGEPLPERDLTCGRDLSPVHTEHTGNATGKGP